MSNMLFHIICGLVTLGPLTMHQFLQGQDERQVWATCRTHLFLTHQDETLARIAEGKVTLLGDLLDHPPQEDPKTAQLANTNLGGDNVHRGAVLGVMVSLACGKTVAEWFEQLLESEAIAGEIAALLAVT